MNECRHTHKRWSWYTVFHYLFVPCSITCTRIIPDCLARITTSPTHPKCFAKNEIVVAAAAVARLFHFLSQFLTHLLSSAIPAEEIECA